MIENDKEAMQLVSKIDETLKYSHESLNKVYRRLNGFQLEDEKNYFPMFHGQHDSSMKKERNAIENMRSFRMYVPEGGGAVRLEDPFKIMANLQIANATYIGYAIPVRNATKFLKTIEANYDQKGTLEHDYLQQLKGTIAKVQDAGLLFATQGENNTSQMINKLQNNFTVATLAMNLGVIFKQQLSLTTAMLEINGKYLRQSGASLGPFNFINPIDIFRQLSISGKETMLPLEWNSVIKDADLKELIDNNPLAYERTIGLINPEVGMVVTASDNDKIKVPFLKRNGKEVYMSKRRMMMGITMLDTLSVLRMYKAVKLETQDRMNEPAFANMTKEQILEHNMARFQELVDKTQPTFDVINKTGLSRDSNPLLRAITMFSSATSKMSMELIESIIDYNNNSNSENLRKLAGRVINLGVLTSVQLVAIDMIWHGLRSGWDDDEWEKLPGRIGTSSIMSLAGSTQGVGTGIGLIMSQLDSEPWTRTLQDPTQLIIQDAANASANLLKGNIDKAIIKGSNVVFQSTGVPVTPLKVVKGWAEKLSED